MDRSQGKGLWFYYIVAISLSLVWVGCSPKTSSKQEGPEKAVRIEYNVLLITMDTLRADYLSCYGSQNAKTPTFDGLAARGVRFAQAITSVPLTSPAHASILTGTYPQLHKIRDNGGFVLDSQIPTLASLCEQAGMETAAFVGAAVLNRFYGLNRGFHQYSDQMTEKTEAGLLPGVVAEVRGDVVTKRVSECLNQWKQQGIGTAAGKKFLLWAHYYDPHFPYDPPAPYSKQYSRNLYAGEVAYADFQLGEVLKMVSALDFMDRTLIVMLGDHGEGLGDHGEFNHGVFLYDVTTHVPMIMAGPGLPQGKVVGEQVRVIDVMPTLAACLGISAGEKVQGENLLPVIREGARMKDRYAYSETFYPKTQMGWSELRSVRTEQRKYIMAPKPELYHLEKDTGEMNNVAGQFPAELEQLKKIAWSIAGTAESGGKLQRQAVNDQTIRELQSLGYASAGLRKEILLDMSGPDPKDRVQVLKDLEDAVQRINHDQYRQAIPLLEKAAGQDPANPHIYQHLGLCYQRLGLYGRAAEVFRRAVEKGVETDEIYAQLGNNLLRSGQQQPALDAMEKAAEMNLANLQNLANLATLYLQMGRPVDAQKAIRALLTQNERSAEANNLAGLLEIQRGNGPQARSYFEKAIEANPRMAEAYMNLGLLADQAGQPQIARENYRKFLEYADPREHASVIPKVKEALRDLEKAQ